MKSVVVVVVALLISGCTFTSRVLDLNLHRQQYIDDGGVSERSARMILNREVGLGMTIAEAKVSWSGGQVWLQFGEHWLVREGSTRFFITMEGDIIVGIRRYEI